MKRTIFSGLWIFVVSLMLVVPVYAHTEKSNVGNGGLGNGMGTHGTGTHTGNGVNAQGTGMRDGTKILANGAGNRTDHDVSVYGTGTGSQFRNGYAGVPSTMNRNEGLGTRSYAGGTNDGIYRTTAVTSNRGFSWGWLGLLGLLGFAGMRSRNPQDNR